MTEHIRNELVKRGLFFLEGPRDPELDWGDLDPCEDWRLVPEVLMNAMQQDYAIVIGTVGSGADKSPFRIVAHCIDWRTGKQSKVVLSQDGYAPLTPWCICAALLDACRARDVAKDVEHEATAALGLIAFPREENTSGGY